MDNITITDMPWDILEAIIKHLNPADLQNMRLTNSRTKDIIDGSGYPFRKLNLQKIRRKTREMENILREKGPQTAEVAINLNIMEGAPNPRKSNTREETYLELIGRYVPKIKTLNIRGFTGRFRPTNEEINLLFGRIEKLTIQKPEKHFRTEILRNANKLQHLRIQNGEIHRSMRDNLVKNRLKTFHCDTSWSQTQQLLNNQNQIEDLGIAWYDREHEGQNKILKLPSTLKHLVIYNGLNKTYVQIIKNHPHMNVSE